MKDERFEYRIDPFGNRKPILVSVAEAAFLLNLSKSYIYRESQAGNIAHVKIGSRILFRMSDLNAWIDGQMANRFESKSA